MDPSCRMCDGRWGSGCLEAAATTKTGALRKELGDKNGDNDTLEASNNLPINGTPITKQMEIAHTGKRNRELVSLPAGAFAERLHQKWKAASGLKKMAGPSNGFCQRAVSNQPLSAHDYKPFASHNFDTPDASITFCVKGIGKAKDAGQQVDLLSLR